MQEQDTKSTGTRTALFEDDSIEHTDGDIAIASDRARRAGTDLLVGLQDAE